MDVKLTKNRSRAEKVKLLRLRTYLPTLKLKKALLQAEVQNIIGIMDELEKSYEFSRKFLFASGDLFGIPVYFGDLSHITTVTSVNEHYENIAGIEVPVLDDIVFADFEYSLLDSPIWLDSFLELIHEFIVLKIRLKFAYRKKKLLEDELRSVSVRVNLFEKKLIPESEQTIRRISVFLGDRSMMEVGQIKIAKNKIIRKIEMRNAD